MKLVALALFACPLFAADIVSAYGHIPGGGFRIPLPDTQMNWKATAIRLVGNDVEKPDARLQDLWANKDSLGNTDFNFQVPVPQTLKDSRYYVISQYGLTPLRIRNIVGAIRYNFDPLGTKPEILKIAFGGSAIFDTIPEDEYVEGAFAFVGDAAMKSEAVDIPATDLTIAPEGVTYTLDGVKRSVSLKSHFTSRADGAALLTIGADRYVFLQWKPEGRSCEYTFTLLKLTATGMEEAASNAYGCEL